MIRYNYKSRCCIDIINKIGYPNINCNRGGGIYGR